MANIQYYTTVEWDNDVRDVGTDDSGLAVSGIYKTAGVPTNTPGKWIAGAMVQNEADGQVYRNAGTITSPNFVVMGGGSFALPIITNLGGGAFGAYDQSTNILGFPIKGVFDGYSDNNFTTSFLGMLAGDFSGFGGANNEMISGFQSFGPGGAANTRYSFDTLTGSGQTTIGVQSGSTQVSIELIADGVLQGMTFRFGGSVQYTLPSTNPNVGDVLTCTVPGLTAWVPGGTSSGIAIGDPITGGGANNVLFMDGSNNLGANSNFAYNQTTGIFQVAFGGGNRLVIDPTAGRYELGDLTGVGSKNLISVVDSSGLISNQFSNQWQVLDSNTAYQYILIAGGDVNISTFGTGHIIKMGDTFSDGNDNFIQIDDFASQTFVQTSIGGTFAVQNNLGQQVFATDAAPLKAVLGDVNSIGNGMQLFVDNSTREVIIGDRLGVLNETKIKIDDAGSDITAFTFGAFHVTSPITNTQWLEVNPNIGGFLGDGGGANNGTAFRVVDTQFSALIQNRFQEDYHGSITAANSLTLGNFGNTFTVTGNTQVNLLDSTNWQEGSKVTLIFTGTPTVKQNQTASGNFQPMFLAGSVDLVVGNNTIVTFVKMPNLWQEISRTVN